MTDKIYDAIIIGGGPAGLSLAYRLKKLNIDYIILEKGELAQSWIDMHHSLRLLSPMYVNQLAGKNFPAWRLFEKIPKIDFERYLRDYAKDYKINYATHAGVKEVKKIDNLFHVNTNKGPFNSRTVVSAAGYFSNPYIPDDFENDDSIKIMHFANYKSAQQLQSLGFAKGQRILIVGKKVSAGQILVELFATGYTIGLCIRNPIQTRLSGLLGWVRENLYYLKEFLRFLFNPYIKGDSSAIMDGGETTRILKSNKVRIHQPIKKINQGLVHFNDGQSESYDLIMMTTGFRASLQHLKGILDVEKPLLPQLEKGEHLQIKGLYFLGIDNMVNFKSRYVRGVVADSKIIAQKIAEFLKMKRWGV